MNPSKIDILIYLTGICHCQFKVQAEIHLKEKYCEHNSFFTQKVLMLILCSSIISCLLAPSPIYSEFQLLYDCRYNGRSQYRLDKSGSVFTTQTSQQRFSSLALQGTFYPHLTWCFRRELLQKIQSFFYRILRLKKRKVSSTVILRVLFKCWIAPNEGELHIIIKLKFHFHANLETPSKAVFMKTGT